MLFIKESSFVVSCHSWFKSSVVCGHTTKSGSKNNLPVNDIYLIKSQVTDNICPVLHSECDENNPELVNVSKFSV